MGPGHNLQLYDRTKVELVWALEPSDGMRRKAAPAIEALGSTSAGWAFPARRSRSTTTASTRSS